MIEMLKNAELFAQTPIVEKLGSSLLISLLGILITFFALALIMGVICIMALKSGNTESVNTAVSVPTAASETAAPELDMETVAVIASAVSAVSVGTGYKIASIKPKK